MPRQRSRAGAVSVECSRAAEAGRGLGAWSFAGLMRQKSVMEHGKQRPRTIAAKGLLEWRFTGQEPRRWRRSDAGQQTGA